MSISLQIFGLFSIHPYAHVISVLMRLDVACSPFSRTHPLQLQSAQTACKESNTQINTKKIQGASKTKMLERKIKVMTTITISFTNIVCMLSVFDSIVCFYCTAYLLYNFLIIHVLDILLLIIQSWPHFALTITCIQPNSMTDENHLSIISLLSSSSTCFYASTT